VSPLLVVLLLFGLAGGGSKESGVVVEEDEEIGFPEYYPFPAKLEVAVLDKYANSAQYGFTTNERVALQTLMTQLNAGTFKAPAQWDVFEPEQVAAIAGVPLDEYGCLAVMTYWLATKSKQRRPWPSKDLEVLGAPGVEDKFDPMGTTVSLEEYLIKRITRYKALLKEAGAPYPGSKVYEP